MDTTILPALPMSVADSIYQVALGLNAEERETFFDRVFRGDADGRAHMSRMLDQRGESAAFFLEAGYHRGVVAGDILGLDPMPEPPPESPDSAGEEDPGSWIGPYRIISRIGEGGCGVIYEAEQSEPVRRHVALKVIRLGMDTESVIARFGLERQALALMDHPNIAHVYDAGTTANGRPYFVMERVGGEKITRCCDRERLDVKQRLQLFLQVCHAIQHAHQKGVIHRDIKPSNVLVTFTDNVPMPKVIDFGIAKAASPHGSEHFGWTAHDQFIGTPPYMSPEQVDMSGIDVDTRSDIYSLGALLYELLCGRPPFDEQVLFKGGISEMRRRLLEEEPPVPSRVVAALSDEERAAVAASRREDPVRLSARLRGDLDWIVIKAMAKDRQRRYQTVNALAADIKRFLSHEPVVARRPSSLYLLEKFVRRNRTMCLAVVAVAASLVGGLGVSTWLYLNERAALAEQERLAREMEAARNREAHLRSQAQARANVSQAAVLLSEGRIEEADALLRESPLESIEPSREAAGVFRALGNWYAVYRRWDQVARCYALLSQANRLDDPTAIVQGTDIIAIAPALLQSGDRKAYEQFRRDAIERYLPAKNSLQAEHLLKVCLLTPADDAMMKKLAPVAEVCTKGSSVPGYLRCPEWESFSLTLYFYRGGDFKRVLETAEQGLSFPDPFGARTAATYSLTAIARLRTGDRLQASRDLDRARALIEQNRRAEQNDPKQGFWFSWAVARFLLREAEDAMRSIGI